jgi:hypothetical protein
MTTRRVASALRVEDPASLLPGAAESRARSSRLPFFNRHETYPCAYEAVGKCLGGTGCYVARSDAWQAFPKLETLPYAPPTEPNHHDLEGWVEQLCTGSRQLQSALGTAL